jgi:hypothetical protein
MSLNAMSLNTIDEFGRDLSLRNSSEIYKSIYNKYMTCSWIDLCYEEEEAEEEAERKRYELELKLLVNDRKRLYLLGKYELEPGEIIG